MHRILDIWYSDMIFANMICVHRKWQFLDKVYLNTDR